MDAGPGPGARVIVPGTELQCCDKILIERYFAWGSQMAEDLLTEADLSTRPAEADEFSRLELLAKWFRGLDDPVRLGILTVLRRGEKSVEELCEVLGLKQPRVSNHLACLRWCGFVATRRQGQRIYYRIADPNVERILDLAQESLTRNAEWVLTCTRA